MDEAQIAHSIFTSASQVEKMGIISFLFMFCMFLMYLLKKSTSSKSEVLKLLESHREEVRDLIDKEREDRNRLYDKMIENQSKTNQTLEEIRNISRQNQEMYNSFLKILMDRGVK